MYYKKYESERIYLSPMNVEDYKKYTSWVNDETLASGVGNFNQLIGEENEKKWLLNQDSKTEFNFAVVNKENDELLGNYGLEIKDQISRRFHVGGFIGEKTNRGKGYGTEALMLITKYAFEILNAHTVYSGILSFNEASLKSAKKAGYKIAGKYREAYFYNGIYYDKVMVEITRKDYESLKKRNLTNA